MLKKMVLAVLYTIFIVSNLPAISNSFIDVRIATYNSSATGLEKAKGRFTMGTGTEELLYGFPNVISTSYTTIKIDSPGNTLVIFGSNAGTFTINPVTSTSYDAFNNSMTACAWRVNGKNLEVSQSLKIVPNPRTAVNKDTLEIKYTITNTNTFNAYAGVRVLLDTQLGFNDNSPVSASGIGRIIQETKWTGLSVPEAWLSVDNTDNPQIKSEGYIKGPGATVPDELIIGQWKYMEDIANLWNYAMHPVNITDTAVAVFWNPVTITANGGTAEFVTYYGLPDYSGAELDIAKTVDLPVAAYDDVLRYDINYSNNGDANLTNLCIWDTMPANASFLDASPGYNTWTASGLIFWPFPSDVIAPGGPYNVWFRVSLTAHTGLTVENRAASSYTDSYWADMEVKNSNKVITNLLTPTITQTHTITPTHTISPTFTITPTYTSTPVALVMEFTGVFPNPSDSDVNFVAKLSRAADVDVRIFTVSGESVAKITKHCVIGQNSIYWDAKNAEGKRAASGVYLFTIEAVTEKSEKETARGKFSLVK